MFGFPAYGNDFMAAIPGFPFHRAALSVFVGAEMVEGMGTTNSSMTMLTWYQKGVYTSQSDQTLLDLIWRCILRAANRAISTLQTLNVHDEWLSY